MSKCSNVQKCNGSLNLFDGYNINRLHLDYAGGVAGGFTSLFVWYFFVGIGSKCSKVKKLSINYQILKMIC